MASRAPAGRSGRLFRGPNWAGANGHSPRDSAASARLCIPRPWNRASKWPCFRSGDKARFRWTDYRTRAWGFRPSWPTGCS